MNKTSGVFVGNGSLLIQCAEAYRRAGHVIHNVATLNPDILAWAQTSGIPATCMDAPAALALPDVAFDYLFSIANLEVLPTELISRARKLAINFHDALLPAYAGLNAPSWALLNAEPVHGITWHEMTSTVDAGRIVRQASFAVAGDETALSLNTKCYEAALSTFDAIVNDIGRGELRLTAQNGVRTYYGRHRRPADWATLDFTQTAAALARQVRALDFGAYANPLARPKIHVAKRTFTVASAEVVPSVNAVAAGTVLETDIETLRAATADGDIILRGCSDHFGQPIASAVSAGQILIPPDTETRARIAAYLPAAARGEAFWAQAMTVLTPVEPPHPHESMPVAGSVLTQRDTNQITYVPLELPALGAQSTAAFFAWLSALTGQERISALYCDDTLTQRVAGLGEWLSPWVPLSLVTTQQSTVAELCDAASMHLAKAHDAGPIAHDLPSRLGDKAAPPQRFGSVGICLTPNPAQPPTVLALWLAVDPAGEQLVLAANSQVYSEVTAALMASQLATFMAEFHSKARRVADIRLLTPIDATAMAQVNATDAPIDSQACVHEVISAALQQAPLRAAIEFHGQSVSAADLDTRATHRAHALIARGVQAGDIVGLYLDRTPELIVSLLAIMKAGAAYLPLDPEYPHDRIAFMADDSKTRLIVTSAALSQSLALPANQLFLIDEQAAAPVVGGKATLPKVGSTNAAYVIYTSGSTGKPKGVVVNHRNVINFFAGMTARVPHRSGGKWLAVTSLSFDISVLELCWTLTQGFTIALHSRTAPVADTSGTAGTPGNQRGPDFSLFYFASDDSSAPKDRYKLLMEGAKFGDVNGFSAIWTPERHFHAFGGLYPNPAVTSAAIAAMTTNIKIRAGSCVLPLHHCIRVAEEWAFVDNISQGRVGISFAAGWQPNDFVIAPQAFANRKAEMITNIDVVRRLWRGERIAFPGPSGEPVEIQTLPRPIQAELPVWVTAAGNPETFAQAGQMGCNLLTHLLGQSVDDLAHKIAVYQAAWQQAGHAEMGHVTVMLHSFVGDNEDVVRETVRQPMKAYLRSSVDLIRQAAWTFPTFVQRGQLDGKTPLEIMNAESLSDTDMDALLEHAFSRYYSTSALFGTPARCAAMVDKLGQIGVTEIACLIDFGVETDTVLAHLHYLKQVMDNARSVVSQTPASVAQSLTLHSATHLQCTPSMASMLVADAAGRLALSKLSALLVGGEALPRELAQQLCALVPGKVLNMYGPTETTVWSTVCEIKTISDFVPLGEPIANTQLRILTPWGQECPAAVPGELAIGGAGVTPGYLERPELTAERFFADAIDKNTRWYRTGDLVRRHSDGALEFLGRIDNQVKIRGHRIELGEIETALVRQAGVREAVVVAQQDANGDKSLIAYVTAHSGIALDGPALRLAVASELPDIMVPRAVSVLKAFPLTPNGKVDRHALPTPTTATGLAAAATTTVAAVVLPETQLEQTISRVWQEVLGLPQVGTGDNFFDLGGHSLLVVQVQRRLREVIGQEISITDMFRLPTIKSMAAHLAGHKKETAVSEGQSRANARRMMRSRTGLQTASVAVEEVSNER